MANEKRLIDANATADAIAEVMDKYDGYDSCQNKVIQGLMKAQDVVADAPTVEAVEVVRCKGCKFGEPSINAIGEPSIACNNIHIGFYGWLLSEDDFCSYGERREGE